MATLSVFISTPHAGIVGENVPVTGGLSVDDGLILLDPPPKVTVAFGGGLATEASMHNFSWKCTVTVPMNAIAGEPLALSSFARGTYHSTDNPPGDDADIAGTG